MGTFYQSWYSKLTPGWVSFLYPSWLLCCPLVQMFCPCSFHWTHCIHLHYKWASQVVQWWRIRLPVQEMQETGVQSMGQILWKRAWQPTSVFLPRKFHGQKSLVAYSPWCAKSQTWLRDWACTWAHVRGHTHTHPINTEDFFSADLEFVDSSNLWTEVFFWEWGKASSLFDLVVC